MSAKKKETKKETKPKKVTVEEEVKPKKKVTKKETKEEKVITKKTSKSKKEAILTNNDQKYFKRLSKVVKFLSKIIRICLMIIVPFVFLFMIMVPILFKHIEVDANIIRFDDMSIIMRDNTVNIMVAEKVYSFDCDNSDMDKILTFLNENSKAAVITYLEFSLLFIGLILILTIYTFMYIEKIFNNFINEKTPFTTENTEYVRKIAIFLCVLKVYTFVFNITFNSNYTFNFIGIIGIIILFAAYYLFKYATGIQKNVDCKIYE